MSNFEVYIDDDNALLHAGKCFSTFKNRRTSSVFNYDVKYFAEKNAYQLDPELPLESGAIGFQGKIPSAFQDCSPDRWGRNLIDKRHRAQGSTNSLSEVDYLLGVSDLTRQGSLRFKLEDNPESLFEHPSQDVPKIIELPNLLRGTRELINGDSLSAAKYLLDAGSASLGGARPKASVRDDNDFYIAKFEHKSDADSVISWEWATLQLAKASGIDVPENELVDISGSKVLLLKRFDRKSGGSRIGYISAMTLLTAEDGDFRDYTEIAASIEDFGADVSNDLKELYRRIAFSILVNNTDDHLRNHGFIKGKGGWKLSPMFDVNPNPDVFATRATSIAGKSSRSDSLDALLDSIEHFRLSYEQARTIIGEVEDALKGWKKFAKQADIGHREIVKFERVFEGL
jgi:serine/threonine-protein kinase HipA